MLHPFNYLKSDINNCLHSPVHPIQSSTFAQHYFFGARLRGRGQSNLYMTSTKFVPVCFFHLNMEVFGSFLNIGKGEVSIGVGNIINLIKP